MFLLPTIVVGVVVARILGGRLSRLLEVKIRAPFLVLVALLDQIVLFTHLGSAIPAAPAKALHLASYALLLLFAYLNRRLRPLLPVLLGLVLNATAIVANGGHMPASESAIHAAGLGSLAGSNVSVHAHHLAFLGDVFALPRELPLANIFSIGDILIGTGMIAFIALVSVTGSEQPLSAARLVAPLRRTAYRRLALGKFASQLGDWVTLAALIGWIYSKTGSTSQVSAMLILRLAPPILGGGLAAVVVDRFPKRRLLVSAELLRGAAVGVAVAGVIGGGTPLVYAALAFSGVLAALTAAALPAVVPTLLPVEEYASANAGLGVAGNVAMAAGSLLAGLALAAASVVTALAVDVTTFAVAAYLYSRVAFPSRTPRTQPDGAPATSARRSLLYVLGRRRLAILIGAFGAATLATGLTNASLPRFLDSSTHLGPGSYGFAIAAISAGLACGHVTVGCTSINDAAYRWIGGGLVGMALLLALLALTTHWPTALLMLGAIGFVDGTTDILFETAVQRDADPDHYGAVFGVAGAFVTTTMLASVVAAPVLNGLFPVRIVLFAGASVLTVAGVVALVGAATDSPPRLLPRTVDV